MKARRFVFNPVLVFVVAQLSWLSLLSLWIYWYISNYLLINRVDEKFSARIANHTTGIVALVVGLILLVAILVGIYMMFIHLNREKKLNRLYDNFIANVTHELKSPLASIQLYLETLNLRPITPEQQKLFVELMLKDARRLNNLINSILQISALEQKQIANNFQISQADSLYRSLIQEAIEQFKVSPDSVKITGQADCRCVVDRHAIKIVIDNLFDNAIKYSTNLFQVNIQLSVNAQYCCVEFSDQGIGISLHDQKRIFSKFHRVYHSAIPNVKGTGLGLYWVKEIIKYHGGRVSVFSEGINKGTTFGIELPIYQTSKKHYINNLLKLTRREKQKVEIHESE
jgi:signal transduction histidine kinase